MTLVAKVEFTPAECGRPHTIEIIPVDQDGRQFLPVDRFRQQVVPQVNPQDPTLPGSVQIVLNLQGIPLMRPGSYSFSILVDDREVVAVPLRAILRPAQA